MLKVKRYPGNPILSPIPGVRWRGSARNPGVVYDGEKFHMVFTADPKPHDGVIRLGYAWSKDGYHFEENDEPWMDGDINPGTFDHAGCDSMSGAPRTMTISPVATFSSARPRALW